MKEKLSTDYINSRFGDPVIRLVCNDCSYRWHFEQKIDPESLEDFEDYNGHVHCPLCGSPNVEEE